MKIKCDSCTYRVISDERDVGCGFVPFCNKGHWGGECEDYNDEDCIYRDACNDYRLKNK